MPHRSKAGSKSPRTAMANRPNTAGGIRAPANQVSTVNGKPASAHESHGAFGWIRTRLSKPRGRIIAGLAIVLTAALAAIGTQLGNDLYAGTAKAVREHGSPAEPPQTAGLGKVAPLGVATTVSWTDGPALALPNPLRSGPDYARLLSGVDDNTDAGSAWGPFLKRQKGAPIGSLHIDMVLTGQAKTAVRVTNVRVQLVGPPQHNLTGTFIPIPHGGGQVAYYFRVNMDSPEPKLTGVGSQRPFPDFNIELAPSEQSTLAIDFIANQHTYKWILLIDYLVGAQNHILKVTEPGGQLFAITGAASKYHVRYASNYPADAGYRLER